MSEMSRLSKENFALTRETEYEGDSLYYNSRLRTYASDLPDVGLRILHSLRHSYRGPIQPHVYAERMRRQDRKDGKGGLTEVHGRLLGLYKYDDIYSAQIFDFQSLINTANRSPYDQHPELSGKLEDAFSEFQDIREKHLIGVAKQLTGTIKRANLYVVCEDRSAGVSEGTETFYTARLSDITHERRRSAMTFNVVVKDCDGNEGLLPPNLYVFAGACAIAS